jgi:hypothetical protein
MRRRTFLWLGLAGAGALLARGAPANQADAFVDLLDELKIERAPIIGGSAGARWAMPPRVISPIPFPARGLSHTPRAVTSGSATTAKSSSK